MKKISFKRVDDFTWEAEAGSSTATIVHKYFGLGDCYVVYVNEVEHDRFDKLAEARNFGKDELAKRMA